MSARTDSPYGDPRPLSARREVLCSTIAPPAMPFLSLKYGYRSCVLVVALAGLLVALLPPDFWVASVAAQSTSYASGDSAAMPTSDLEVAPFSDPQDCSFRTGIDATIVFPVDADISIHGAAPTPGDEITVYSSEGVCVGRVQWSGENVAMTVWGDDMMTPEADGLLEGDEMHFHIQRSESGSEHSPRNAVITVEFAGDEPYLATTPHFVPNGIYIVRSLTVRPVEHASVEE